MTEIERDKVSRLVAWQEGKFPGPRTVILFPTMRCNLNCGICWHPWEGGPYEELGDERLLRLVDESAELGVREWVMVGGGEPMVRADVVMALCSKIKQYGMHGSLFTNGTLFRREHVEHLVAIRWDLVRVSLDGPSASINDAIRSKGAFNRAVSGLSLLRDVRRASGVSVPETGLHMTLTQQNLRSLEEMLALAGELDCREGVSLSGLITHDPGMEGYALTAEDKEELPHLLEQAISRGKELGVANNFVQFLPRKDVSASLDRSVASVLSDEEGLSHSCCYDPWLAIAINAIGQAGPCCAVEPAGTDSVRDDSLMNVWMGRYMTGLREQMITGNLPAYCRSCPHNLAAENWALRQFYVQARIREARAHWPRGKVLRDLGHRGWQSIKQNGVAGTIQRGIDWLRIYGIGK